jgi:hypothetical protein
MDNFTKLNAIFQWNAILSVCNTDDGNVRTFVVNDIHYYYQDNSISLSIDAYGDSGKKCFNIDLYSGQSLDDIANQIESTYTQLCNNRN